MRVRSVFTMSALAIFFVWVAALFGAVLLAAEPKNSIEQESRSPWPAEPPNDAVRLFSGTEEHQFVSKHGAHVDWPIHDGTIVSTKGERRSNHIVSRFHFRDADIHVEFQVPMSGAGNSGIYIHGHYELQIITPSESEELSNKTHGAIYGFSAPLVAAGLARGEWQAYDIRYESPRRDDAGAIVKPGRISAWLNGRKVQSDVELLEPRSTFHPYRYRSTPYLKAVERRQLASGVGPIFLQDHDSQVKFRNVWVRPLDDKAIHFEVPSVVAD